MRKVAKDFLAIGAVIALQAMFPVASLAIEGGELDKSTRQAGEDRWVPSLAITSGGTFQDQDGFVDSCLFPGDTDPDSCNTRATPPDLPLRGFVDGDDRAVSPFVGGVLELMSPALAIPTRPRFFANGEILPTFASDRDLAIEGDPGCVRGEKSGAPCARDGGESFGESDANGLGSRTSAEIDTLVFGASLGVAFPIQVGKRQLRIKPSVGWINYKVKAEGLVVDAACNDENGDPECVIERDDSGDIVRQTLRERVLTASGSQRFNGIGPGLDIEMDTGRYGPLGVSLFMGGRAYAVLGDRTLSFRSEKHFDEQHLNPKDPMSPIVFGPETDVGTFEVEVDPWIFRAHVGIRFHWLGKEE